jgi:hypothetical protein
MKLLAYLLLFVDAVFSSPFMVLGFLWEFVRVSFVMGADVYAGGYRAVLRKLKGD